MKKIGHILCWIGCHKYDNNDEWYLEESWEGNLIEYKYCERCGYKKINE